jgi:hypothetical protein
MVGLFIAIQVRNASAVAGHAEDDIGELAGLCGGHHILQIGYDVGLA